MAKSSKTSSLQSALGGVSPLSRLNDDEQSLPLVLPAADVNKDLLAAGHNLHVMINKDSVPAPDPLTRNTYLGEGRPDDKRWNNFWLTKEENLALNRYLINHELSKQDFLRSKILEGLNV